MIIKLSKYLLAAIQSFVLALSSLLMLCSATGAEAQNNTKDWCKESTREQVAPPSIFIATVERSGTSLVTKFRIKGSFEGVCIKEAAIYENGRLIRKLRSNLKGNFQRFEFMTIADLDKNPEIRVYTIHGDRAVAQVKPNSTSSSAGSPKLNIRDVDIIITRPYIIPIFPPIALPNKVLPNKALPNKQETQK